MYKFMRWTGTLWNLGESQFLPEGTVFFVEIKT